MMLRKDEQKALKCSLENLTTTGKGELPQQQGVRPWQGTELHRKQRTERASSKLPSPPSHGRFPETEAGQHVSCSDISLAAGWDQPDKWDLL